MEFFTNRKKITSKWTASYSTSSTASAGGDSKRMKTSNTITDNANFDGKM